MRRVDRRSRDAAHAAAREHQHDVDRSQPGAQLGRQAEKGHAARHVDPRADQVNQDQRHRDLPGTRAQRPQQRQARQLWLFPQRAAPCPESRWRQDLCFDNG